IAGLEGRRHLFGRHTCPDGESVGQRLGGGGDVRGEAELLPGEPGAGAADACLDVVDDQQGPPLVAQTAHRHQIVDLERTDAAFALGGLHHHCGDGVVDHFLHRPDVAGGTWTKPGGRGWNVACLAGWPVAARVARVRPWNESARLTMRYRSGPPRSWP